MFSLPFFCLARVFRVVGAGGERGVVIKGEHTVQSNRARPMRGGIGNRSLGESRAKSHSRARARRVLRARRNNKETFLPNSVFRLYFPSAGCYNAFLKEPEQIGCLEETSIYATL